MVYVMKKVQATCESRLHWDDMLSPPKSRRWFQQEPVAGFDVAKQSSVLCVLSPTNDKFIAALEIKHTQRCLEQLAKMLKDVEEKFGNRPVCVMEATGHCFKPLPPFSTRQGMRLRWRTPFSLLPSRM